MKYHLIDDNKVRLYFETSLVYNSESMIDVSEFSFILHNVKYALGKESLILKYVQPLKEGALALTTEGLVEWNNPAREPSVIKSIENPDYLTKNGINQGMFCSNFICIGKLPSHDAIPINKDNIVALKYELLPPRKLEDVKSVSVKENDDQLTIGKLKYKYTLGLQVGNDIYVFGSIFSSNSEIIISRGTCFISKLVIRDIKSKKPVFDTSKYYELCY